MERFWPISGVGGPAGGPQGVKDAWFQAKVGSNGQTLNCNNPGRIFSRIVRQQNLQVWLLRTQRTNWEGSGTHREQDLVILVLNKRPFLTPGVRGHAKEAQSHAAGF